MPDRADQYDFANPKHRRDLDLLSIAALTDLFGEPAITAEWDMPALHHWQPGAPRPLFANEDPAVMQAIGMCAASRVRRSLPQFAAIDVPHPATCQFCDLPLDELLAACDWSTFEGRTQTAEWLTWTQKRDGTTVSYQRRMAMHARNERHERFWSLAQSRRADLVRQAQERAAA